MTTSLNNSQHIEKFLTGTLSPVNKIIFAARLIINADLRNDLYFQKKTYLLVKHYHRKKLKEELETLHQQIFTDPYKIAFQRDILKIFG